MKKDISIIISTIAIVLSIVTIILFFIKVSPNSVVDSNTFIGVCTACIGIAVTFIIGYQIVNALQIKEKLSTLEKTSIKLEKLYAESEKKMQEQDCKMQQQNYKMQEGFELTSAIRNYYMNSETTSRLLSFLDFHEALVFSVKTDRTEYDWIFYYMKKCIFSIVDSSFRMGQLYIDNKTKIDCSSSRKLEDIINDFNTSIKKREELIRNKDGFRLISIEYNKVMELYQRRISDILKNKLLKNQEIWKKEENEIGIMQY